jgi:hypothetical protein
LLLVISDLFAVPISVLWVGVEVKIDLSKDMSSFVSGNTPSAHYFENDPTLGHDPPHNKLWCITKCNFLVLARVGGYHL